MNQKVHLLALKRTRSERKTDITTGSELNLKARIRKRNFKSMRNPDKITHETEWIPGTTIFVSS